MPATSLFIDMAGNPPFLNSVVIVSDGQLSQNKHIHSHLVALVEKNPPANTGDIREVALIPGSRRSSGVGNGNPLLYFCLENPMDREAWQATVHRVAKSQTRLKRLNIHTHRYTHIRIMVFKIRCASLYFHESFNQDFNLFTFSVINAPFSFNSVILLFAIKNMVMCYVWEDTQDTPS